MISFNQIPIALRTPGSYLEVDNSRAVSGLPVDRQRVLIIGQRFAAGTGVTGVPQQVLSAAQAVGLFGQGSNTAQMCAAFKAANPYADLWALPLNDGGSSVAATGTITIAGTATAAGTLRCYVGGLLCSVAVASGDTATVVGTALASAITANKEVPLTAANVAGVVTLTSKQKGEVGNFFDLRFNYYTGETTPAGLTVSTVAMSGGTGNPDIAAALTAIGDVHYQTFVVPWIDASNLGKIEAMLATRFGPMVQREGLCYVGASGTVGVLTTLGTSRNSPYTVLVGSGKSPTPPWVWGAAAAGLDTNEPDPARPRQTLVLPTVLAPALTDQWTQTERNTLLYSGISTFKVAMDGQCSIERLITTYALNAYGLPDTSYLDVETMRTIAYLRYTVRVRITSKYPRHKLANDGTVYGPGQAIVTPKVLRGELIALFREWESAGLAEDIEQFKQDLVVERNASDPNRVDAVIPPNVVNQFRVFAGLVQFRL
jgi:phage tail sheath gpL-like